MPPRPVTETIAILQRTLDEIERDLDPVSDGMALGELKRIILNRIAELELESVLQGRSPGPMVHAAIGDAGAAQSGAATAQPAPATSKKP